MYFSACAPFFFGLMNGPSACTPRMAVPFHVLDSSFRLRQTSMAFSIVSIDTVIVVGRKPVTPFCTMPAAILRMPSGLQSQTSCPR